MPSHPLTYFGLQKCYLKVNLNLMVLDSVGVEHIPKEIKRIIGNKNIFRIQTNDWIMFEYFCIEFIDFMLKGKNL